MQRLRFERDFAAPRERVFDHLAEHEHLAPLFGARVERICDGADGHRNGVGSARRVKVGPLPGLIETVTEFVPHELIRYRITHGSPLRDHEGTMRFTGDTHLHYEVVFGAGLPGVDVLVAALLRRSISRGLAGLPF